MPQPLRARYRRRGVVRKSHPSLHCQAPKSRLNQRNDNAAYDADYNSGYGPYLGVLRSAICAVIVATNPFVVDLRSIHYGHNTKRQAAQYARGYGPSKVRWRLDAVVALRHSGRRHVRHRACRVESGAVNGACEAGIQSANPSYHTGVSGVSVIIVSCGNVYGPCC